jgi:amino acid transporter
MKMVAWEFVLLVSPFGLVNGGTPAVFWGLIISPIVMLPVYASLAEVASMSPTAGGKFAIAMQTTAPNKSTGQYHWVSELAPPRFQKGLSYTTGWLITLGWQTFLCGVSFSVVGFRQSYHPERYVDTPVGIPNPWTCCARFPWVRDSRMASDTIDNLHCRMLRLVQCVSCGTSTTDRSDCSRSSRSGGLSRHCTALDHGSTWQRT